MINSYLVNLRLCPLPPLPPLNPAEKEDDPFITPAVARGTKLPPLTPPERRGLARVKGTQESGGREAGEAQVAAAAAGETAPGEAGEEGDPVSRPESRINIYVMIYHDLLLIKL